MFQFSTANGVEELAGICLSRVKPLYGESVHVDRYSKIVSQL